MSYGSPGIDQPGGQDGWILAEFLDLFYYQINLFIYFISYFCLFLWTVHKHARKERPQYSAILTEQKQRIYSMASKNISFGTKRQLPSG